MSMSPVKIMIVDDSIIIRGIINRILGEVEEFCVIATAIDGDNAVKIAGELKPDFIILDINMPRKDGLTALPEILSISPDTKIIIASSLTNRDAKLSMKALKLGASECLNIPDGKNKEQIKIFARDLINAIFALSGRNPTLENKRYFEDNKSIKEIQNNNLKGEFIKDKYKLKPKALAIASSTGGPNALNILFKQLKHNLDAKKCNLDVPVFITQHMPPTFTNILANNIKAASGLNCSEGVNEEIIKPNYVYVAPGDYHMTPEINHNGEKIIKINQLPLENYCRPSADPMMRALFDIYGKNMMMVILTGMGHDGLAGADMLAGAGGIIVAQDKASSVVWGMPKAVIDANLADMILPLEKIADYIVDCFCGKDIAYAV